MTISSLLQEEKDWEQGWGFFQEKDWGESCQLGGMDQTNFATECGSKGVLPSFPSLRRSFTTITLFFFFVAISLVTAPRAHAARGKDGTNPGQPVNNVNVAMLAPVHPVHPRHNVVIQAEMIIELMYTLNQLTNIPMFNIYAPPIAPNLALPRVPSIDRSPNHEEKWKGDLTQENLDNQRDQGELLGNQGNLLRYELYELDSNHNLLTPLNSATLTGCKVSRVISRDRRRFLELQRSLGSVVFAEQQFQVGERTLEEYRKWYACANTLFTAIQELRRHPR